MKSLTEQRIVLNRERAFAISGSILGGMFILSGLAQVALGGDWVLWWLLVAVGLIGLVSGVALAARTRRQIRSFELEHGADAGKSKSFK
jgi:hypothetical protein